MRRVCFCVVIAVGIVASAHGAELPLRQIIAALFDAKPGEQLDFSGKDLSLLDLSGVDFKRANVAGANLLGDDLTGANLSNVNLAGAKLDRTAVARTNFNGADLSRATLFDAVGSLTFEAPAANAPTFVGANLSGARIFARLSRADFRGANLAGAHLGTERNQFKMPKQTDLSGALFGGANLERADLTGANLIFANMATANLKDAILAQADLSNADLSGALIAGADFTDANIYGTVFRNAKGLESVKGLDRARNRHEAIFCPTTPVLEVQQVRRSTAAGELEHARANARAGGPVSEQDAELLERWGCLSGTRSAFCRQLDHRRRHHVYRRPR